MSNKISNARSCNHQLIPNHGSCGSVSDTPLFHVFITTNIKLRINIIYLYTYRKCRHVPPINI